MYDEGFDGRGQAVAILDTEFDTGDEFFSSPVESPRFSKEDIKNYIESNELHINAAANQVYKSSKIPFAYDYSEGDADTYSTAVDHGMHVAGIAAGKNGVFEGTMFSGAAPEAQLVLMKIGDDDGVLWDDDILAALDDASKMGVCAVNMSLGDIFAVDPLFEDAVNNLRNTGTAVICSAGNNDRYAETTDVPDYIYNSSAAYISSSTSVASINADKIWVFGGTIILGSGEELTTDRYSDIFFKKFADEPCEYVYGETLADFEAVDVTGKIAITPYSSDAKSGKLLDLGAAGVIFISSDEITFDVSTASDDIPGIMVTGSCGEKLRSAEKKTIQTVDAVDIYNAENPDLGMSYFTSWGTNASLELKPEITAPGGEILSSVNDDQYINYSGTSMATPQITGAIALMSGFVEEKYPEVSGTDKVALMENILMSSADIVFQDDEKTLPESPRRQGAGLADLEDALTIPVILKGDTGKSKLSLRDELGDNITLTFTAENLTEQPVTYDDIKIYAFTDNYEEQDGKNMITDSVPLKFTSDKPESVTIPANGEKEITIDITLDSAQTAANKEIFTNGFWVDGFVVLSSSDGSVTKTSMPYTGFYGDWTSFDAMTPSYFEDGGSAENGGLMLSAVDGPIMLGTNVLADGDEDKSEYESEDYVGLSKLYADDYYIYMRILRSMDDVSVTVKNSSGDIIDVHRQDIGLTRKDSVNDYMETIRIDPSNLSEDDYSVTVSGRLAYDSERSRFEEKTYKFYVDTTPPEISDPRIYEKDGKTYAAFEAIDNRYLMGAAAHDANNTVIVPVKAEKRAQITIDITGMDRDELEFAVADYALNENYFSIGSVSAEITDSIISDGGAVFAANVKNTDTDIDADVIMALYSYDGRLVGIEKQSALLESGAEKSFSFGFANAWDALCAKLFVWKHDEMVPLCDPCIAEQ